MLRSRAATPSGNAQRPRTAAAQSHVRRSSHLVCRRLRRVGGPRSCRVRSRPGSRQWNRRSNLLHSRRHDHRVSLRIIRQRCQLARLRLRRVVVPHRSRRHSPLGSRHWSLVDSRRLSRAACLQGSRPVSRRHSPPGSRLLCRVDHRHLSRRHSLRGSRRLSLRDSLQGSRLHSLRGSRR